MTDATAVQDRAQALRCFQALSDETRLQIVEMLAGGELCVCDLQAAVGAYQSRLSFHLRKLKDAGLVTDRKQGRWVYYSLDAEAMRSAGGYLREAAEASLAAVRGACCG